MTRDELIAALAALPENATVVLEDLNGLWWTLSPELIRVEDETIVIGDRNVNAS